MLVTLYNKFYSKINIHRVLAIAIINVNVESGCAIIVNAFTKNSS